MSENFAITVVIPTFNRAVYLRRSIESLLAQKMSASDYEILIVDDGSTDNTRETCMGFASDARVKYAPETNQGIAAAKNRGVELARGNIILFFDDDDVADPQLLAEHLKSHAEHPNENVAVLGHTGWDASVKVDPLMDYIVGKGGFLFSYGTLKHGQFYDYTYFWGGRSSCKRRLLLEHGLFNPVFTFGSEDIELGYRLSLSAEFKVIYNEKARSHMIRPINFENFLARCQRQGKSQAWFSRLHPAREIQKWCNRPQAEGIWEFLKIDFERQVRLGRKLTEDANELSLRAARAGSNPGLKNRLKELSAQLERIYCRIFTKAKYEGLVEELHKLGDIPEHSAKQTFPDDASLPAFGAPKRILIIDLFIPVFNRASGCFRAFQLLKMLRELGYEVTFLAKYPQYADEYASYLEELGIEVIAGDPLAMEAGGTFSPCPLVHYDRLLGNRRWDLAVISFWDNAECYLPLIRKYSPTTPIVIDTVDIVFLRKIREAGLFSQQGAMAAAVANKERELAIYRKADRLWVVTEADRAAVGDYVPGVPIDVVSNVHPIVKEQKNFGATKDLLFVGNFWHMPNVDAMAVFCELIFPLIQQKRPDIKVQIAGDNAPPGLKRYHSQSIQFLGHVPDLSQFLKSSRVSIAPLRYGAGMKGKIGEALSWSLPVVTTTIGAEGMNLVNGEHALIADSPMAFAEAVLRVYQDETLWIKLSRNGPVKVEGNWGYEVVKDKLAVTLAATIPNRPLVSIIILALNQLEHTRACLESLAAHVNVPHEIIIVDNGSTDGTPEFLRQWRNTHENCAVIRNETNRGFSGGNNQGLAVARGDYLLLLNNDTIVTRGLLENLLGVFDRHPHTGIVGPVSNNVSGHQRVEEATYGDLQEMLAFAKQWMRNHRQQSFEVSRAVGFCLVAKRQVIHAIAGLDERFGSGNFEDDDFSIRAQLAGFRIRIAKDAFIHHTGSQTFKGAKIDYRRAMQRNWELFKTKWKMPADWTMEKGYRLPVSLPDGVSLKAPLPDITASHQPDATRRHWEEISRAPKAKAAPVTLPPVAQIGQLGEARKLLGQKKFPSAWKAAFDAISKRPFHPEALLLLAEIALAASDSASARQCAQRAREIAPDWSTPKQFLKKSLHGNAKPEWLKLPDEIKNQKLKIRNSLSICLIVKNEEQFLAQCLKSIRDLAQQIIVVDTGSTDRTVEIAKEFGAEIYSHAWNDDFAAARNAALEHATGDWILVLDADEELPEAEHEKLRADMGKSDVIAYRLPLVNRGKEADGQSFVPRLFRNAPGVYYFGRIHEQVFPSLLAHGKSWGLPTHFGTAQLLHHGYTKEMVRDRNKIERNLKLLRQAIAENPTDANLMMNFGLELVRTDDLAGGVVKYREAFELMSAQATDETAPELREVLLTQFTCQLYKIREHEEVVRVLNSPLAKKCGLTASLHFALGLSQFELKNYGEAAKQMQQCLAKRKQLGLSPINTDILTVAPEHCLALSLAKLGDAAGAEKEFQKILGDPEYKNYENVKLDYANFLAGQNRLVEALQKLHELVAVNARNIVAWRTGGEIALSKPEFLEFARDWTGEAMRYVAEDFVITMQRAEALMLGGDTASAVELWERIWSSEREPRILAALILCEVIELPTTHAPQDEREEAAASRAFIGWYRKLLTAKAQQTIVRLNGQTDKLSRALPGAAKILESTMAEVDRGKTIKA
jgi:glycosyltransferase involved in cell wall biosynthesis